MASFVNLADVISAAVEIEKRGHKFYLQAAREATQPQTREFFSFMAEEELRHEKIFTGMLERASHTTPLQQDDQEYLDYLQSSLDSHLFFLKQPAPKEDPYKTAMSFEKDSISYFNALLPLLPESEKPAVQRCIDEEKTHMVMIHKKQQEAG